MKFIQNIPINGLTKEDVYLCHFHHISLSQKILFALELKKLVPGGPMITSQGYDNRKFIGYYEVWFWEPVLLLRKIAGFFARLVFPRYSTCG